jgi:DnaJ-class molecular chaperone
MPVDYYELLQLSTNAEAETISRTYRLLAQRYHPDNQHTGDETRFRQLVEAYELLTDPERARQMGLDGRRRAVEKFSWSTIAEDTMEVYRSLL